MSKKVKYIKPNRFFEVFEDISEEYYNVTIEKKDRDLLYDRNKWIRDNVYWYEYLSNDEDDIDTIYQQSVRTISEMIHQCVLFNRVIRERMVNEFNLPKGEVPLYLRQIDEKGTEEDLYNISTGKIIKKWSKKKKGRKKLEEIVLKQNHNKD
tara:strand:- start:112 stop:567 length:456 start_codon:yes stop_codon:yes gene_type:complete